MHVANALCHDKPIMIITKVFFCVLMLVGVIFSILIAVDLLPMANSTKIIQASPNTSVSAVLFTDAQYSSLPHISYKGSLLKMNFSSYFKELRYISYVDPHTNVQSGVYFYNEAQYDYFRQTYLQTDFYVKFCNDSIGLCQCLPTATFNTTRVTCWLNNVYDDRKVEMKAGEYVILVSCGVDIILVAAAAAFVKCCHSEHKKQAIKKQKVLDMKTPLTNVRNVI